MMLRGVKKNNGERERRASLRSFRLSLTPSIRPPLPFFLPPCPGIYPALLCSAAAHKKNVQCLQKTNLSPPKKPPVFFLYCSTLSVVHCFFDFFLSPPISHFLLKQILLVKQRCCPRSSPAAYVLYATVHCTHLPSVLYSILLEWC